MRRRGFMAGMAAGLAVAGGARADQDWDGYPRLLHGPMLGWTGPDTVTIWARVSAPVETAIEYRLVPGSDTWTRSANIRAEAENDYIVRHTLRGLPASAEIAYRLMIDGAPDPDTIRMEPFRARTAPASPARFRFGFGSCARRQRHPVQPIWDALERADPDLFFWLGDNIYGDTLNPAILREEYLRQRDIPNCRTFMAGRSQLAVWDDHDFALNDSDTRNPVKAEALQVFKQVWANPSAGLPRTPGVFFAHSFGGVDFFCLDNRYHRDPASAAASASKTALGTVQRDWLKQGLKDSRSPFKLILCGQPWNDGKAVGNESWASFTSERADLIAFIARERIAGVVLLSGDTHVGELNCLTDADYGAGYDLFELVSSPLAQDCATSYLNYRPVPRVRQVYAGGSNAGIVDIDMSQADPTLRFTLIDTQGNSVWTPFELHASEVSPGRTVWRDKADAVSLARWDRSVAGGRYYGPPD